MKKFTILSVMLLLITSAFSQQNRDGGFGRDNDQYRNDRRSDDRRFDDRSSDYRRYDDRYFSIAERDSWIRDVRYRYDQKIREVQWNRFMKNREKRREINYLEQQRDEEIRRICEKYDRQKFQRDSRGRGNGRRF